MRFQFRDRDKRAVLGLTLAIGAYMLIADVALPAFDEIKQRADTVAQKEDELRRYRRALISKDHYSQLLQQAQKSTAEGEARLIRGDNASLASVELQTIVEESAKKVGIILAQRNMTPPRKKDDYFNEIAMTLSFESTPNQLTSFLAELRLAPKFLVVKSLQASPVTAANEPPAKGELQKTVKANLTVAAVLSSPPVAPKG